MSSRFTISIPERLWKPFEMAPRDGSIIFVRDSNGEVDLIAWDKGEWCAELGTVGGDAMEFAETHISKGW